MISKQRESVHTPSKSATAWLGSAVGFTALVVSCSVYDASLLPSGDALSTSTTGSSSATHSSGASTTTGSTGATTGSTTTGSSTSTSTTGGTSSTTSSDPDAGTTGGITGSSGGSSSTGGSTGPEAGANNSGSSGSSGSMTTGSTTGASCPVPTTGGALPTIDVIDDLEDGNGEIDPMSSPKRDGYWSTFNDGTKPDAGTMATQTPVAGSTFSPTLLSSVDGGADSTDTSLYAARTYGAGFKDWGAAMGFDLNANGTVKSTYNASGYAGFTFLAKVGAGASTSMYVRFVDKNTLAAGGVCNKEGGVCDAYFQKKIMLTQSWQRFFIPFCDPALIQPSFGVPQETQVDSSGLYSIQFQVLGNSTTKVSFDIWVDDPGFYK